MLWSNFSEPKINFSVANDFRIVFFSLVFILALDSFVQLAILSNFYFFNFYFFLLSFNLSVIFIFYFFEKLIQMLKTKLSFNQWFFLNNNIIRSRCSSKVGFSFQIIFYSGNIGIDDWLSFFILIGLTFWANHNDVTWCWFCH